jgi:hypothetical protein
MGKYKEYIEELAFNLGKDFEDIDESDIQFDFMKKAQGVFSDRTSTLEERNKFKEFLPKISKSLVSDFYKVGDILDQENTLTGNKSFYIIVP